MYSVSMLHVSWHRLCPGYATAEISLIQLHIPTLWRSKFSCVIVSMKLMKISIDHYCKWCKARWFPGSEEEVIFQALFSDWELPIAQFWWLTVKQSKVERSRMQLVACRKQQDLHPWKKALFHYLKARTFKRNHRCASCLYKSNLFPTSYLTKLVFGNALLHASSLIDAGDNSPNDTCPMYM